MKFMFKRKYTFPFMLFLLLVTLCVAFYYYAPQFLNKSETFYRNVLIISLVDSLLIVMFVTGLYRVNYFLYHDRLVVKRSLVRSVEFKYSQIKKVVEIKNDPSFLIFGRRTAFKVYYESNGRIKKCHIRLVNPELFKLILENEKKISTTIAE